MPKSISNLLQLKGNISVNMTRLMVQTMWVAASETGKWKTRQFRVFAWKMNGSVRKKLLKYKNESGHQEKMQMDKQRTLFKATNIFRILVMMNLDMFIIII